MASDPSADSSECERFIDHRRNQICECLNKFLYTAFDSSYNLHSVY